MTFVNGFLAARFSAKALETENFVPTYEEVNTFMREHRHPEAQRKMRASLKKLSDPARRLQRLLTRGELVVAIKGEFKGLKGIVIDKEEDAIRVDMPNITTAVRFKVQEIRKSFEIGQKVEVLVGARKGTVGTVIKYDWEQIRLIMENSNEEVSLLTSDVKKSSHGGLMKTRMFKREAGLDKYDLVTFNNNRSVGMIVGIGTADCEILDSNGCVSTMGLVQINAKMTKGYVGKNQFRQEIKSRYTVKIMDGARRGSVLDLDLDLGSITYIEEGIYLDLDLDLPEFLDFGGS